jgi:hypothetical protein
VRAGAWSVVVPRHGPLPRMSYEVPRPIGSLSDRLFPDFQNEVLARKTWLTERTDSLPGPVSAVLTTYSEHRDGPGMASTGDGWPQFIKSFDEWRERKAREGDGRGFFGGWMDARTGQGGNSNGLRSSARSGGCHMTTRFNPPPGWPAAPDGWTPPPGWQFWVDGTPTSPHRAMDSAWTTAGGAAVFLGSLLPFVSFSDPAPSSGAGTPVNPDSSQS